MRRDLRPSDTDPSDARCEGVTWNTGERCRSENQSGGQREYRSQGRRFVTAVAVNPARAGVALQPVIDLIDRVDLGYEALPRPRDVAPCAVITAALSVAQHTGPAVLLLPLASDVLAAGDFDLAEQARRYAVNPGELAWIIRSEIERTLDDAGLRRLLELRELGFLLAVDGVRSRTLDRRLIADLRPDFVFLDQSVPARLHENEVARARLAAAVVYVVR